jgi:hypothetical protein
MQEGDEWVEWAMIFMAVLWWWHGNDSEIKLELFILLLYRHFGLFSHRHFVVAECAVGQGLNFAGSFVGFCIEWLYLEWGLGLRFFEGSGEDGGDDWWLWDDGDCLGTGVDLLQPEDGRTALGWALATAAFVGFYWGEDVFS